MPLPDWARAHGPPLFSGIIRTVPEDFQVQEILNPDFSGSGEHDWLLIEKTGANTDWVAQRLAAFAGCRPRDVGYSGLKDRHAVATQWFSVPAISGPDWSAFDAAGVTVLDVQKHSRKLRRGMHRGNRFRIVVRGDIPGGLSERLHTIDERGVPNYFGEQRFGRDAGNLELADRWAEGGRLSRHRRGLAMSTIRSFVFNEQLSERVVAGTWERLIDGDTANLDGSGSVFAVDTVDADLEKRCADMDIHPTGSLPGEGTQLPPYPQWQKALNRARVSAARRSLRLRVRNLNYKRVDGAVVLRFALGKGAFATSVLREVAAVGSAGGRQ